MKADKKQDRIMTGLIGNIDVYLLNGQTVMRARPKHSKRPLSDDRKRHLSSFQAQKKFAHEAIIPLIRRIWNKIPQTGGMNGYNLFIKTNSRAFNDSDRIVFPEFVSVSEGILCPATDFGTTRSGAQLQFSWGTPEFHHLCYDSDQLNIAFLVNKSSLQLINTRVERKTGKAAINFPEVINTPVDGYAFWSSSDDRLFSPSIYWHCE